MKKISLLLALVFTLVCACAIFGACQPTLVDYAAELKFEQGTSTIKEEVTVKTHIDGDTVHFNVSHSTVSNGVLKARFLGVNTPESTGKIEEWGKAASNFTKEKLKNAVSIYIESDTSKWEADSTGGRYLAWIWYKTDASSDYRLLNLELLQEGLAWPSNIGGHVYTEYLENANKQAQKHKLHIYSDDPDPDFHYGDAIVLTLEALRLDTLSETSIYAGSKVAVEGIITYNTNGMCYLQAYNAEQDRYYGMAIYYGFGASSDLLKVLRPGNEVRLVGSLQLYEAGGTWQISGLQADAFADPSDTNYSVTLSQKNEIVYTTVTGAQFVGNTTILDENDEEVQVPFAELAMGTCVKMENLKVVSTYSNPNAETTEITITCQAPDGTTISLRTEELYYTNENGMFEAIKPDFFNGKTITVMGNIDKFGDTYQIKIETFEKIIVIE